MFNVPVLGMESTDSPREIEMDHIYLLIQIPDPTQHIILKKK